MDTTVCAVPLFGSGALLHDDLFFSVSVGTYVPFLTFQKAPVGNGRLGHLVHA